MKKILIVEDEPELLNLIQAGLSRRGFDVAAAADGNEALVKTEEFRPQVVVLDIMLPGLNGLEVLKIIKERYPHIFVMLATAKNELADLKTGYAEQADYYVTKPYQLNEIYKGVDILLSLKED